MVLDSCCWLWGHRTQPGIAKRIGTIEGVFGRLPRCVTKALKPLHVCFIPCTWCANRVLTGC